MSLRPTSKMMKKMGYDACYEISDVEQFLHCLPAPLHSKLIGYGEISYQPKAMHFDRAKQLNPALIKEPEFAYQAEARALWRSGKHPIEAAFVEAPKAAGLCKIISL